MTSNRLANPRSSSTQSVSSSSALSGRDITHVNGPMISGLFF